MTLSTLFTDLAAVFTGGAAIETHARDALIDAAPDAVTPSTGNPLPQIFLDIMQQPDAHPVCTLIAQLPFEWSPPRTSDDPLYADHSLSKVHVELLGPGGLVKSDTVRLGLYGMHPHSEYGIRTHPAEEIYVMLAGEVFWKLDDAPYALRRANERSHHPSMMPHANKTGESAFMSIYVWHGDISTENYAYAGLPDD